MRSKQTQQTERSSPSPPPVNKWAVMVTVMCGLFMVVMDFNIVTVALPAMMHTFRTDTETIKLVVESYALSYAVFTLTGAWLRERFGITKIFLGGLVLFLFASLMCGLSWSVSSLVAFRILKGIGGGIMMPTAFTMMTESFPPNERGKAFGIFGTVIVFAPSIGPLLGGYLVDQINWSYVFFINIPIGAIVFIMGLYTIKDTRPLKPGPFDLWGFLGLSCWLASMLAALNMVREAGWTSPIVLGLLGGATAGMVVFLMAGSQHSNPIINISLFRNFHFSILMLLNGLRSFVLFARIVLLPLFFQTVLFYSATKTGLILAPGAIAAGLTMPAIGPLIDRLGPRWFIFWGFIIQAAGSFMMCTIDAQSAMWYIIASMIIAGIGTGMAATPITSTSMNVVPRRYIGQVSIILTVVMQIGQAFGVAVLAAFAAMRADTLAGQSEPATSHLLSGYHDTFFIIGALCLLCLIPTFGTFSIKPATAEKQN